MHPSVVNAICLVPIDWDLPVSLQFCSCSSILDPMQVGFLMILVASFPLLGSFEATRSVGFDDFCRGRRLCSTGRFIGLQYQFRLLVVWNHLCF